MPLDEEAIHVEQRFYQNLVFLEFGAMPENTLMETNGGTLAITMNFNNTTPTLTSGPFGSSTYRFEGAYFNWLMESRPEYNYGNLTFPAELHLVFHEPEFDNVFDALDKDAAVAILAYGIKESFIDYELN